MKLVLFFLFLFIALSVLYGIAAGVQTVAQAIARVRPRNLGKTGAGHSQATDRAVRAGEECPPLSTQPPEICQMHIAELNCLFRLYQAGALTRSEFERLKHYILLAIPA